MIFEVSAELDYTVRFRSAMILSVHAQRNAAQTILAERFGVEPKMPVSEYADALCRALNIPSRYFTGYVNGLVRIATGRDAADTAVASVFGSVTLTRTQAACELGEGQKFVPIPRQQLARRGVVLPTGTD